jgi:hypothetical protein
MIKAIITGFVTGVIISAILVGATYIRGFYLPDTFTANLFFMALFFVSIAGVLWLGLNYYCKTSAVKWMTLSVTGIISSVIAAILVTIFQAPFKVALYNFRDLMIVLFIISLAIAAIYYVRNRKRDPQENQELIF